MKCGDTIIRDPDFTVDVSKWNNRSLDRPAPDSGMDTQRQPYHRTGTIFSISFLFGHLPRQENGLSGRLAESGFFRCAFLATR